MILRLTDEFGVPAYVQLQQQVRAAMRTGELRAGDRLPSAREVVSALRINHNTISKAYRGLVQDGLVVVRQGVGTFVVSDLLVAKPTRLARLRADLHLWIIAAEAAGVPRDDILEFFASEVGQHKTPKAGT